MTTRILFEIELPGWSLDDIRMAVRQLDALECGEDDAIAVDEVGAWDVLALIASGELGMTEVELTRRMVEGMDANGIPIPFRPNFKTDVYSIVQDKIYNV